MPAQPLSRSAPQLLSSPLLLLLVLPFSAALGSSAPQPLSPSALQLLSSSLLWLLVLPEAGAQTRISLCQLRGDGSMCVDEVYPRVGSPFGEQMITVFGTGLRPLGPVSPAVQPVNITMHDPASEEMVGVCDYHPTLSTTSKIVCTTRAYSRVDEQLGEGVVAFDPATSRKQCESSDLQVRVTVLQYGVANGGLVEDSSWNRYSRCSRTKICRFTYSWSATPLVVKVTPEVASPGDLITVFGKTCVADEYDSESRRVNAALKQFERAYIGGYLCELSKPQCDIGETTEEERCPTMYAAETPGDFSYMGSLAEWQVERLTKTYHHACVVGSFQCRIPEKLELGPYNISFTVRAYGKSALAQQALVPLRDGVAWQKGTIQVSPRINEIVSRGTDLIVISGEKMDNESTVFIDDVPCPVVSAGSRRIVCNRTLGEEIRKSQESFPKDCAELLQQNPDATSGTHLIKPNSLGPVLEVFCDMDTLGGGWTLCGKFDRDNEDGRVSLDDGFGRSLQGDDSMGILDDFGGTHQVSIDCRPLLEGSAKGHMMSVGTDIAEFDGEWPLALVNPISPWVFDSDASELFDEQAASASTTPCELGGMTTMDQDAKTVDPDQGLTMKVWVSETRRTTNETYISENLASFVRTTHPNGTHFVGAHSLWQYNLELRGTDFTDHWSVLDYGGEDENEIPTLNPKVPASCCSACKHVFDDEKPSLYWQSQYSGTLWVSVATKNPADDKAPYKVLYLDDQGSWQAVDIADPPNGGAYISDLALNERDRWVKMGPVGTTIGFQTDCGNLITRVSGFFIGDGDAHPLTTPYTAFPALSTEAWSPNTPLLPETYSERMPVLRIPYLWGLHQSYGVKITGWFVAPVNGTYKFAFAPNSIQTTSLSVSPDSSPLNNQRKQQYERRKASGDYRFQNQMPWMNLTAGQHYYIEVVQYEKLVEYRDSLQENDRAALQVGVYIAHGIDGEKPTLPEESLFFSEEVLEDGMNATHVKVLSGALLSSSPMPKSKRSALRSNQGFTHLPGGNAVFGDGAVQCMESEPNAVMWGWQTSGGQDHSTLCSSLNVGTGCGAGKPPTYRYNLLFLRRGTQVQATRHFAVREAWFTPSVSKQAFSQDFSLDNHFLPLNPAIVDSFGSANEIIAIESLLGEKRQYIGPSAPYNPLAFVRDKGLFLAPVTAQYEFVVTFNSYSHAHFLLSNSADRDTMIVVASDGPKNEKDWYWGDVMMTSGGLYAFELQALMHRKGTSKNGWLRVAVKIRKVLNGRAVVLPSELSALVTEDDGESWTFNPIPSQFLRYTSSDPSFKKYYQGAPGLLEEVWRYDPDTDAQGYAISDEIPARIANGVYPSCSNGLPTPRHFSAWPKPNETMLVSAPASAAHDGFFIKRWSGFFKAPSSAEFRFSLKSDTEGRSAKLVLGSTSDIRSGRELICTSKKEKYSDWLNCTRDQLYWFELWQANSRNPEDGDLRLRLEMKGESHYPNSFGTAARTHLEQSSSDRCAVDPVTDFEVIELDALSSSIFVSAVDVPWIRVSDQDGNSVPCTDPDGCAVPDTSTESRRRRALLSAETDVKDEAESSTTQPALEARFLPSKELVNLDELPLVAPGMDAGHTYTSARRHSSDSRSKAQRSLRSSTIFRWSDPSSWPDNTIPNSQPPYNDTAILYVPGGSTVILDTDVYVRYFVIEGRLEVDTNKSVHLQAEGIIVNGGEFAVGTQDDPYNHSFTLTLHGDWTSPQIPIFGVKVLGATSGSITMFGRPTDSWTRLAATAHYGQNTILVQGKVDWVAGDKIVITATSLGTEENCTIDRDDACETEEKYIIAVSYPSADSTQLLLDGDLQYTHLGVEDTIGGQQIPRRAEVGKLNRNVVIEGTEVENHGAHTMIMSPSTDGPSHFHFVEFRHVGQSFVVGRYPVHFHLVGQASSSVAGSSVLGCSIHKSFNRAINCHACNDLLVERNVVYKNLGHAFFIEDGLEQGNIFKENLGILTLRSMSLLESDQTPSTFWVTNPNNTFQGNVAAGSHSFGYWWNPPKHPGGFEPRGASHDESILVKFIPAFHCHSNVAHSCGEVGFLFSSVHPTSDFEVVRKEENGKFVVTSQGGEKMVVEISNVLTYGNGRSGLVTDIVGHLQINGLRSSSEPRGMETVRFKADSWATAANDWTGPLVTNSLFYNNTDCGIGGPQSDYLTINGSVFKSDAGAGLCGCATCVPPSGGVEIRAIGLIFEDNDDGSQTKKMKFGSFSEAIVKDVDGCITGWVGGWAHGAFKGTRGHLPEGCSIDPLMIDGLSCDNTMELRTFRWGKTEPSAYLRIPAHITTRFGLSLSPWYFYDILHRSNNNHFTVVVGEEHNISWPARRGTADLEFFDGEACSFRRGDKALIRMQTLTDPYAFSISDKSAAYSSEPLSLDNDDNSHADWSYQDAVFDDESNLIAPGTLEVLLSASMDSEQNPFPDGTEEKTACNEECSSGQRCLGVIFERAECPSYGCLLNEGSSCPMGFNDREIAEATGVKTRMWSNVSSWAHGAPEDGSDVVIERHEIVYFDVEHSPVLNKIDIRGTLIFDDEGSRTLRAYYVNIAYGGTLKIGTEEERFQNKARIEVFGHSQTEAYPYSGLGNKFIAVFGELEIYGSETPEVVWSTSLLNERANAGDNTISVRRAVLAEMQIGEGSRILLSSADLDGTEVDDVVVSGIEVDIDDSENELSTATVTLTTSLEFNHWSDNSTFGQGLKAEPSLASEVAVMDRNVVITGMEVDHGSLTEGQYGVTIQVLRRTDACVPSGTIREGVARIDGATVKNCGVYGSATKACIAFAVHNEGRDSCSRPYGESDPGSFVRNSVIESGFNAGLAADNSMLVEFSNNIVHNTLSYGIRVEGYENMVLGNLALMTLRAADIESWESVQKNRYDVASFYIVGIMNNVSMNVAGGSQGYGFQVSGDPCHTVKRFFQDNRVHSSPWGVHAMGPYRCSHDEKAAVPAKYVESWPQGVSSRDGYPVAAEVTADCVEFSQFTVTRAVVWGFHVGGFAGITGSVKIKDSLFIDSGSAISLLNSQAQELNYGQRFETNPHKHDKTRPDLHMSVESSRIVGGNYRCRQVGVIAAKFYEKSLVGRTLWQENNPLLYGGTVIKNVVFEQFGEVDSGLAHSDADIASIYAYHLTDECGNDERNFAIQTDTFDQTYTEAGPDANWAIQTEGLSWNHVAEGSRLYMVESPTEGPHGGHSDRGCAQFRCDGNRNGLVIDMDGTLLSSGQSGTAIFMNEKFFDDDLLYTDPLGAQNMKDLVPFTLAADTGADVLGFDAVWTPGFWRDGCSKNESQNLWECPGGRHRQLLIEDMTKQAAELRIAPVALVVDGHLSLYTGPKNYAKFGYVLELERLNTFWTTSSLDKTNIIYFTGATPSKLRVHLRDVREDEGLHLVIYYNTPNKVNVFRGGKKQKQLDMIPNSFNSSLPSGSYFFDRSGTGRLHLMVKGSDPIDIRVSQSVQISSDVVMTEEEFFATGFDGFVSNLAALLGIPPSQITVLGAGGGSAARRRLLTEASNETNITGFTIVVDPPERETISIVESTDAESDFRSDSEDKEEVDDLLGYSATLNNEISTVQAQLQSVVPAATVNSVSEPDLVIPGWNTNASFYNASDKVCHCGYGIWDPDCTSVMSAVNDSSYLYVSHFSLHSAIYGCEEVLVATDVSVVITETADDDSDEEEESDDAELCPTFTDVASCIYSGTSCCWEGGSCGVCGLVGDQTVTGLLTGSPICAVDNSSGIPQGVCDYLLPQWEGSGKDFAATLNSISDGNQGCDCERGRWDPDCEGVDWSSIADSTSFGCPAFNSTGKGERYLCQQESRSCFTEAYGLEGIAGIGVCVALLPGEQAPIPACPQASSSEEVRYPVLSWGSLKFTSGSAAAACAETRSFRELTPDFIDGSACSGGLGRLMTSTFRVWVCIDGHRCLDEFSGVEGPEAEDKMCYVFDETSERFVPWDFNSRLSLVPA